MRQIDFNPRNDDDDDSVLFKHLRHYALTFPKTHDELERFIQSLESTKLIIPDTFKDASCILRNGLQRISAPLNLSTDRHINENMAYAAREGKDMSESVLAKMRRDRINSEKDQNDH